MKITSMESVNTRVIDKNQEHYLRIKGKGEKSYDVLSHIQLHMSKYKKYEDLQSIMSNLQSIPLCQTYLNVSFDKCVLTKRYTITQLPRI